MLSQYINISEMSFKTYENFSRSNSFLLHLCAAYWKNRVERGAKLLARLEKFKADESKRPGNPKTTKELFGIEGSFRKLEID